jgi:hypothetical protein
MIHVHSLRWNDYLLKHIEDGKISIYLYFPQYLQQMYIYVHMIIEYVVDWNILIFIRTMTMSMNMHGN